MFGINSLRRFSPAPGCDEPSSGTCNDGETALGVELPPSDLSRTTGGEHRSTALVIQGTGRGIGAQALRFVGDAARALQPTAIPFNPTFDAYTKEFGGEVFVGVGHPTVFIEKESFQTREGERLSIGGPYLSQKYFWAESTRGDAHFISAREGGSSRGGGRVKSQMTIEGGIKVHRVDDVVTMVKPDGRELVFEKVGARKAKSIQARLRFFDAPDVYEASYVAEIPGGVALFVDEHKHVYGDNWLRCFAGTPGNMERLEVEDVARYRDGGTTIVRTDFGTLHVRPPQERDKPWTFHEKGSRFADDVRGVHIRSRSPRLRFGIHKSMGVDPGQQQLVYPERLALPPPQRSVPRFFAPGRTESGALKLVTGLDTVSAE